MRSGFFMVKNNNSQTLKKVTDKIMSDMAFVSKA
jgi:hypothetical protein